MKAPMTTTALPTPASIVGSYSALLRYVHQLKGSCITVGEREIIEALARDGATREVE